MSSLRGPAGTLGDPARDALGDSRLPIDRELVNQLAEIWVDYQLLGHAAA